MKNITRIWTMIFVALMCIEMANFVIANGETTTTTPEETTTTQIPRRYFSLSYTPETPTAGECVVLKVTDKSTGDEVKDADVDVTFDGVKAFYGVTTEEGTFEFCPTKAGSYKVEIDKTRYRQSTETITVGAAVVATTTVVTTTTVEVTTTEEETTEEITTTEEIPTTTEEITTTTEMPTTTEVVTTTIAPEKGKPDITTWMIVVIVIVIILVVLYMMSKKKKTEPEEKAKKGKEKGE